MRISEADILIHPGLGGGSPEHWYSGWERKFKSGRRIEQSNWHAPDKDQWIETLVQAVDEAGRSVIIIAHSLGVISTVMAAPRLNAGVVKGAFLVAPPDLKSCLDELPECKDFLPVPTDPLPFPSVLVASRTDPYCRYEVAEDFSYAWGSALIDAGDSGHLNADSCHGPWPEGMLRVASFLNKL